MMRWRPTMIRSRSTMPKIDDAAVRAAAMNAGYSAERAMMKGCWRLRDDDGKLAINPATKATAFTAAEVISFTKAHHADLD